MKTKIQQNPKIKSWT